VGDEADAYMERQISLPRGVYPTRIVKEEIAKREKQASYDAGYKQGVTATRSNLIMQLTEWLIDECGLSADPCWPAHVAVEQFKCGCDIGFDWDDRPEPRACPKWNEATEEQKNELFQNVFGYSHAIYQAKVEAKKRRAQEAYEARLRAWNQQQRQRVVDRLKEANVDPELLP
jgi:hypothetical protein